MSLLSAQVPSTLTEPAFSVFYTDMVMKGILHHLRRDCTPLGTNELYVLITQGPVKLAGETA